MRNSIDDHTHKIRDAIATGQAARSVVVASWQRCTDVYGMQPDAGVQHRPCTHSELRASIEQTSEFLSSCETAFDRLRQAFSDVGACILISGLDGVVVRWSGWDSDTDVLRRWGLWPGYNWCEDVMGTNGVGTCLVDRRPVFVDGPDHFYPQPGGFSCYAAPLHDHLGGLVGILNVTLYGKRAISASPNLILGVVTEAARQMELDRFHKAYSKYRIQSVATPRSAAALLAVDADGVVVGATRTARNLFNLSNDSIERGCCFDELIADMPDSLEQAERAAIRRMLIRHNGNITVAAAALQVSRATLTRKVRHHGLQRLRRLADSFHGSAQK